MRAADCAPREISTVMGESASYWAASKSVSTSTCGSVRVSVTTGRPCPSASTLASPAACAWMSSAERERAAGDLEVDVRALQDLQEHAVGRPALVVLTRGVQEARAPAERGGRCGVCGDHLAQT